MVWQAEELRAAEEEARREAAAAAQRIRSLEQQLQTKVKEEGGVAALAGRLAEAEQEVVAGKEREERLRLRSEAAEERAREASQLAQELAAKVARMEAMEAAAKEAAAAAEERLAALARQVEEMKRKEQAAAEVSSELQQRVRKAEASDAASQQLVAQLEVKAERAEKETRKAREALGEANERVTFFFRIMKGLRDRERAALDAVAEANARLAEVGVEAAQRRRREEVMKEAWTLASERVELLSQQVARIETMRVDARQVAEAAAKEFLQAASSAEVRRGGRQSECSESLGFLGAGKCTASIIFAIKGLLQDSNVKSLSMYLCVERDAHSPNHSGPRKHFAGQVFS